MGQGSSEAVIAWTRGDDEQLQGWLNPAHTRRGHDMNANEMIPSKYLKQEDIDGERQVTVKALKKVNVARDDEEAEYRWTISFQEFEKAMVLNATNIKRMAKALGEDTDTWIGGQVILYVDPDIEYGGKVTGGLRIRGLPHKGLPKNGRPNTDEVNRKLRDAADNDVPF